MGQSGHNRLRAFMLASTALATLASSAGINTAFAQDNAAATNAQLRSQVQQLMTLLHTLSEQNQAQIDALSAQVKTLQGKVANVSVSPPVKGLSGPPHVVESKTHRFGLESADGQYSIALTGRLHLDAGDYLGVSPRSRFTSPQNLTSGFNARRARIGVTGKFLGDFGYTLIYDFGNSSDANASGLETAQITYNGFKNASIEFGYSDTFYTMDEATGSNDIMFMERSVPGNLATNMNAGDNRANFGGRYWGDRYWIGAYFTGPQSSTGISYTPSQTACPTAATTGANPTTTCATVSDSHEGGERIGAFQRFGVQALAGDDYSLHIGANFDELLKAPNTGANTAYTVTLSDRPNLRIDPTSVISTGALGTLTNPVTSATIMGPELAGNWRGLYAQGEYFHYDVDRRGLPSADFEGAYGQVGFILTGEERKYNPQTGTYPSPTPAHPFSLKDGGYGAVELTGRFDYVDLNYNFQSGRATQTAGFVAGGRYTGVTAGVNWYLNSNMRILLNYVHGNYIKANATASTATTPAAPLGAQIGERIEAIAARAQINW